MRESLLDVCLEGDVNNDVFENLFYLENEYNEINGILESLMTDFMADIALEGYSMDYALEANIVSKIKGAFSKLRKGKATSDRSIISEARDELKDSVSELKEEEENAETEEEKKQLSKKAKAGIAAAAAALIATSIIIIKKKGKKDKSAQKMEAAANSMKRLISSDNVSTPTAIKSMSEAATLIAAADIPATTADNASISGKSVKGLPAPKSEYVKPSRYVDTPKVIYSKGESPKALPYRSSATPMQYPTVVGNGYKVPPKVSKEKKEEIKQMNRRESLKSIIPKKNAIKKAQVKLVDDYKAGKMSRSEYEEKSSALYTEFKELQDIVRPDKKSGGRQSKSSKRVFPRRK